MKKIFVVFFLILPTVFSFSAQNITEEEMTGTWKVLKVETESGISPEVKSSFKSTIQALLKSKFIFQADKNFSFDIEMTDIQIKNAHWKLDTNSNAILVQQWQDKDKDKPLLMGIRVKKEGEKTWFILYEGPFILEVEKQNIEK